MFERIGSLRMADSTRAEVDDAVTEHDLRQLAERPEVKTLQCSAPTVKAPRSQLITGFQLATVWPTISFATLRRWRPA